MLRTLGHGLERALGDGAAELLQEVGFASGDEVYELFAEWLRDKTAVDDPGDLDAEFLGRFMSDFFAELGWGGVQIERMGASALCIEAPDWAEASPSTESEIPRCHITTGLLAAFLGKLAEDAVAVMEVECRTRGDDRCRFLAGSPETLQAVFEGMTNGSDYEALLTVTARS